MNLARFQGHKIVEAGKIVAIADAAAEGYFNLEIQQADGTTATYTVGPKLFARGPASIGDYLVRHDDGYDSWSPAKAFEDGYTRIGA